MKDLIDRQSLLAQIEMAQSGSHFDTVRKINGEDTQYAKYNADTLIAMINDMPRECE